MAIERLCRDCFKTFRQFTTLQNRCGDCQYKHMMALNVSSNARKPIKRVGKKGKEWITARERWIAKHPPDDNGYWYCYLRTTPLCPVALGIDQLTLDHVIPRSKGKPTMLAPACVYCNGDKGSQDLDYYLAMHERLK